MRNVLKDIAINQVAYPVAEASLVMMYDHSTGESRATSKATSSTHTNTVQDQSLE